VIEAIRRSYAGLKPNHKKDVKEYGELMGCVFVSFVNQQWKIECQ